MTNQDARLSGVRAAAPSQFAQFDAIAAHAARLLPSSLHRALEDLVAVLLQVPGASRAAIDENDHALHDALTFAEQFVIDVSGMTDELRNPMYAAMGRDSLLFVQVLYVNDVFERARIGLTNVFRVPYEVEPQANVDAAGDVDSDIWSQIEAFMRDVALLTALDPLTTELVRLQGARVHNCRVCQSRLSVRALDAAATADKRDVFDALHPNNASQLSERERVAIKFADALVTQPAGIDATFAQVVREALTAAEIAEIALDVVRNAANKIAVAFGADAPAVDAGIEFFDVDTIGNVVADIDPNVVRSATR